MKFNFFERKSKNEEGINTFKNREEVLNMHFSKIKFPKDFNIKRTGNGGHFIVKKEGVSNGVSVIVDNGMGGKATPKWEIMTEDLDGNSHKNVSLNDYDGLIKAIDETFSFDYRDHLDDDDYLHDIEDENLQDDALEGDTKDKNDYGNITPESQI